MTHRLVADVLLGAALVVACQTTPSPSTSPAASQASPPDDAACRALIEAADLLDAETIFAVDACRFTPAGAAAAAAVLGSEARDDAQWAAIWVYASAGSDPAPLEPLLSNHNPSLRAMTATTLVAFGDRRGFEALRALLRETGFLAGSAPPMTIDSFVVGTLSRYVVAPGVPAPPDNAVELASVGADWEAWLAANEASLTFGDTDGTWGAP